MLSILENIHDGKLRQRSEVYIIKDRKLLVGISSKGKITFPGGALESGESPKSSAVRETLEEVGVQIKNINPHSVYEFDYTKEIGPWKTLPYEITRWGEIGMRTFVFTAEFDKENKKIFNSAGDGRKYIFMTSGEVIRELSKIKDPYNKIRVIHQIKIIKNLKKKGLIN